MQRLSTAQAFQGLGKLDRAREAVEAGIKVGKESGDVMLYVELVETLRQWTLATTAGAMATQGREDTNSPVCAPVATAPGNNDSNVVGIEDSASTPMPVAELPLLEQPSSSYRANGKGAAILAETLVVGPSSAARRETGGVGEGGQEGSGEEGDGNGDGDGGGDGDGDGDDNRSVETTGATGEGESGVPRAATKKKKKKKKKKKAAKTTWEGEENASGGRLTLTANKEGGGGVVVEGLSGALAASDISPVLLEAARAQLCHAVGDPDVDNLIALGYLQVFTHFRGAVLFYARRRCVCRCRRSSCSLDL